MSIANILAAGIGSLAIHHHDLAVISQVDVQGRWNKPNGIKQQESQSAAFQPADGDWRVCDTAKAVKQNVDIHATCLSATECVDKALSGLIVLKYI